MAAAEPTSSGAELSERFSVTASKTQSKLAFFIMVMTVRLSLLRPMLCHCQYRQSIYCVLKVRSIPGKDKTKIRLSRSCIHDVVQLGYLAGRSIPFLSNEFSRIVGSFT